MNNIYKTLCINAERNLCSGLSFRFNIIQVIGLFYSLGALRIGFPFAWSLQRECRFVWWLLNYVPEGYEK